MFLSAAENLPTAPLPKAQVDLEHGFKASKKAGMDAAAAAFFPSRPPPQAQPNTADTSDYAAPIKIASDAAPQPPADVAESKIQLRPEAAEYFPVAKTKDFFSTFPDKVS